MTYDDIRTGTLFYDRGALLNREAVATSDCRAEEDGQGRTRWRWSARCTQTGDEMDYMITDGADRYPPRISATPTHARRKEDGGIRYPLAGGEALDPDDPVRMSRRTPEACAAWAAEILRTGEATPLDAWFGSFSPDAHDPDMSM